MESLWDLYNGVRMCVCAARTVFSVIITIFFYCRYAINPFSLFDFFLVSIVVCYHSHPLISVWLNICQQNSCCGCSSSLTLCDNMSTNRICSILDIYSHTYIYINWNELKAREQMKRKKRKKRFSIRSNVNFSPFNRTFAIIFDSVFTLRLIKW